MYSVLLVDDEIILREGMRKFIPWNDLGFEVTAEAGDGAKALERIMKGDVDLMFLDIKMPRMSGVDLLRELAGRKMNVIVVVLSGYNDFEYTRAAIQYGAVEYLMKPVEVEEVVQLLKRIYVQLEQQKRHAVDEEDMFGKVLEAELIKTVNQVSVRGFSPELWDKVTRHYRDSTMWFVAFAANHDSVDGLKTSIVARFHSLFGENSVLSSEKKGFGLFVFPAFRGRSVCQDDIIELCRGLINECKEVEGIVISPAIPFSQFIPCLKRAVESGSIEHQLFYAAHQPVSFDLADTQPVTSEFSRSFTGLGQIIEGIRACDKLKVQEKFNDLYFYLQGDYRFNLESIYNAYFQLLRKAAGETAGLTVHTALVDEVQVQLERVFYCRTLHHVHRFSWNMLERFIGQIEAHFRDKKRKVVKEIKQYVDDHIAEPILLSVLADKYAMSIEYLSVLFKKEEGKNFNQYLKGIRIVKAAELIRANCNMKIYELAFRVGYSDSRHFTKVFKECTGLTPREYADRH